MEELFTYLLKSSGLIIAFFLAYHFLLRKETFFNSNRWFLLSGLGTAALLPLFFIKRIVFIEQPRIAIDDLIATSKDSISNLPEMTQEVATIDWYQIVAIGYGIIVFILVLKVIVNLFSLSKLLKNKQIEKQDQFTFVDLQEDIAPFSFFHYIVFNSSLYSDNELTNILLHEKIHSKEKHSFDVLLAKLFTILFWFNPIVWLYKKAIVQNLEYIADSKATQLIEDKKSYQKALLKVVSHQNYLPITNHFYQSLIKKRIIMLNKNQSNKRNSWKYAVILPALIGFVLLFQIKVVAQEKEVSRSIVDLTWTKNSSDKEFKEDAKNANKTVKFDFTKIERNNKDEITSITISFRDNLGNDDTATFENKNGINPIHFIRDIDQNGKGKIGFLGNTSLKNKEIPFVKMTKEDNSESEMKSNDLTYIIDEISSDKDLNDMINELKKLDIKLNISNLKRDRNNEIISIKLDFKDKKGHKGATQQQREIPIRPIFFKISDQKNGFDKIGFYNNSELENKPYDKILDTKLSTIEKISDDALIFVDDEKYSKETLKTLDPNHLVAINVLNDAKSLEKYGAKDRKEVIIIKTDWKTNRAETVQERKTIIFSNDNGDEIVFMPTEKLLKLPGYPSARLNDGGLILIVNGVQKTNPVETLNQMNLQNVKSVRVYDENGKETPGTQIKKIIITTK